MREGLEGIARDWVESEHRLGVLPLLDAFFAPREALGDVVAGRKLGALGLFTPTPEPGWGAGAVAGEPGGGGAILRGAVRLPSPAVGGSIVLVRLEDGEHRLAWLDHDAPGIAPRGSGMDGGPCWLHIDGAVVGADLLSRPVTLDPGGELVRCLEAYASAWAAAAVSCARDGVRALRRAARTGRCQTSQLVALAITEVEIEVDLTASAVRRTGGLAVAAAAARILGAVAAKTEELRDRFGLEVDGPLGCAKTARSLTAFLGGSLQLESALARHLGIGEACP